MATSLNACCCHTVALLQNNRSPMRSPVEVATKAGGLFLSLFHRVASGRKKCNAITYQ
jgi:hypothetical protein